MQLSNTNIVIVPWDFSKLDKQALERAFEMCDDPSLIRVVHVAQSLNAYEYSVLWRNLSEEKVGDQAEESFRSSVADDKRFDDIKFVTLFGDPGRRVCEFAKDFNAELIILPSHGRVGISHVFLGSVAERVVRFAPCPVLVLRNLTNPKSTDPQDKTKSAAT